MRKQPKPLVVFTPKSLLRNPACVSSLKEFSQGTFQEIIDDTIANPKRILLCSGKVYYDLFAERKRDDVALVRIEQLYPFHREKFQNLVQKYRGVEEWRWVQEEHKNDGAWTFIRPLLEEVIGKPVGYVGRGPSSSPAAGSHALHKKQYLQLIEEAFK